MPRKRPPTKNIPNQKTPLKRELDIFTVAGIVLLVTGLTLLPFLAVPATIAFARAMMLTFNKKVKDEHYITRLRAALAMGLVASIWLLFL